MLDIQDMSESTKLYFFLDALKPWAQQELQRRNVKNLAEAMVAAERLTDYIATDRTDQRDRERKETPQTPRSHQSNNRRQFANKTPRNGNASRSPRPTSPKKGGCFLCGGNHFVRDCPNKNALNALVMGKSTQSDKGKGKAPMSSRSGTDSDDSRSSGKSKASRKSKSSQKLTIGVYRMLNSIKTQAEESKPTKPDRELNDLMFVNIKVNGERGKAMIDLGATHNFITKDEAEKCSLKYEKTRKEAKSVNAESRRIVGVAKDVPIKIGEWSGVANFNILPMDDFQIILGMEFMRSAQAAPMPYLNTLCIMAGEVPCYVRTMGHESKGKEKVLAAMQCQDGSQRGQSGPAMRMKGEAKVPGRVTNAKQPKTPGKPSRSDANPRARRGAERKKSPEPTKDGGQCRAKRVETIFLQRKKTLANGTEAMFYLVKWKGLPMSRCSWKHEDALQKDEDKLVLFKASMRASTS